MTLKNESSNNTSTRGKWKPRWGIGRRNKKATSPEEPDHGDSRRLSNTKRNQHIKGTIAPTVAPTTPQGKLFKKSVKPGNAKESRDASDTMNPQSPFSNDSFGTDESDLGETDDMVASPWKPKPLSVPPPVQTKQQKETTLEDKQRIKERDGFCRRVDSYDGNLLVVDGLPTYELANYLGGGVAGVVYQGHRLRPLEEYPTRGHADDLLDQGVVPVDLVRQEADQEDYFCSTDGAYICGTVDDVDAKNDLPAPTPSHHSSNRRIQDAEDLAIEATINQNQHGVMLDAQDAPSRSHHFTKAAAVQVNTQKGKTPAAKARAAPRSNINHGLTDEAVAIKILNPVGFRILGPDALKETVVVKRGDPLERDVKMGTKPMEARHVWWIVNPNSRNLRTLQRYNGKDGAPGTVQVDRGSKSKGLRLSLIAAYVDPRTNKLKELTLTRCIEIWGHIPFDATELEFEDMISAIERVNAGHAPVPLREAPGRVGTDVTGTNSTTSEDILAPVDFQEAPTGLLRAAMTERVTVFCGDLNAYIAIPAVPSKYIRWLRQRRAATKEVRNMMSIGRHPNVLHLFEVLEFIQESKSTMFLILELVKGGELFDLISSSAGKGRRPEDIEQAEQRMRKFFFELASGINFCHKNGIAHRDLKPENLLVHNGVDGQATLKIADFGLSACFEEGANTKSSNAENDTLLADSVGSPMSVNTTGESTFSPRAGGGQSPTSQASGSSVKDSMDKLLASGASALSFLTCGAMETVLCMPNGNQVLGPSPFRRMTSVVGSPHYVAPEIISQGEDKNKKGLMGRGYDGAKADVWSAGVILYAMLFRSLPFGEDLLRCPRYQSYRKWYDEVRTMGGRRSSAAAALNPYISDVDERDYLGPHWFFPAATSKVSRDLIVAMLNPRPEDRLSVAQVLEHPWVVGRK
eukprot:Nitzschia sp. Nitz4//scaffold28_size193895//74149//77043//NITZ4_001650-RA/size193895-augustus-gene-0.306-mRNA-1//-1//CDS//3329545937//3422//frame0